MSKAMEHKNMLKLALEIATKAHSGQIDMDGTPHIEHVKAVSEMGDTDDEKVIGMLHDVIEDSSTTLDDLSNYGFSEVILKALDALTHKAGMTYAQYLDSIIESGCLPAIKVKMNDLKHNLSRSLDGSHEYQRKKYSRALAKIEQSLRQWNLLYF